MGDSASDRNPAPRASRPPGPAARQRKPANAPQSLSSDSPQVPAPHGRSTHGRTPTRRTRQARVESSSDPEGWVRWAQSTIRGSPAMMFSILLHVVILLAMGIATIASVKRQQELVLSATMASPEPVADVLETVELQATDEMSLSNSELDSPLLDLPDLTMADVQLSALSESPSATQATTTTPPQVGRKQAGQQPAMPKTKPGKVSNAVRFCGTSAVGKRFAFVVDNSNSMVHGKMLATIDQLLRAVDAMQAKQEFFVVLYSDVAYPMFYPDAATDFAMATNANKRRLREWLKTIEINPGGNLEAAMKLVFALKPDAVFILGDGSGYGDAERAMLIGLNPLRKCTINTVALGAGPKGAANLQEIARVNRGQFQSFQTHPIFVEMAKSIKFRKNSKGNSWSQRVGRQ